MSSATVNQWLQTVGAAIGQPLELDERGLLALELQSGLVCTVELDSAAEVLTFHSDLLSFYAEQMNALSEYALEKNLYCLGSYGITLGLDKVRLTMVASTSLPLSALTEESFLIFFERFISAVEENHGDFQRFNAGPHATGRFL